MRTVADILSTKTKPANVIASESLVLDALQMMKNLNLSYVIVKENGTFKGIFSERDYSRNVALEGKTSKTCLVREAMSTGLVEVCPENTVEECIHFILEYKMRYLPVFENGDLVGVVTIHDILREALRSKEALFDSSLTDRLIDEGGIY
jgi:CBS domain-containing protein